MYPKLRIVLEHITTAYAVEYIDVAREGIAATITAHHLLENRNAIFQGGINPHLYCLPILKREADRLSLVKAATSGNPGFFLGLMHCTRKAKKKRHAAVRVSIRLMRLSSFMRKHSIP